MDAAPGAHTDVLVASPQTDPPSAPTHANSANSLSDRGTPAYAAA